MKIGDQFQRGEEIIECMGNRIDGIQGHLFAFFHHIRNTNALPTFFTLRIGTMEKKGWTKRESVYEPQHPYLPDVAR